MILNGLVTELKAFLLMHLTAAWNEAVARGSSRRGELSACICPIRAHQLHSLGKSAKAHSLLPRINDPWANKNKAFLL